jgi:hypothetical protein
VIKFEINEFPFALTNDQWATATGIMSQDWTRDYDIVEGDQGHGLVWLWVHYGDAEGLVPSRYWIEADGNVSLVEDVDWDWDEGGGNPTPQPERVEMDALYPHGPGESAEAWTNRVLSHSAEHGVNRQCSLGWHGECSDRSGETCRCLCHDDATRWFSVEGDITRDGAPFVLRAEQGKQRWPAKPDDPATMWAVWIMATSDEDARIRAIKKEEARRG